VRVRLRGQKRVPRPPARITAWIDKFFSCVVISKKNEFSTQMRRKWEAKNFECSDMERYGTDAVSKEIFPLERNE